MIEWLSAFLRDFMQLAMTRATWLSQNAEGVASGNGWDRLHLVQQGTPICAYSTGR